MIRARRTDATQREIVKALRQLGWIVVDLSRVGNGCPDLLASRGGEIRLVECKTRTGKLTPLQEALMASGLPVRIVRSAAEALTL